MKSEYYYGPDVKEVHDKTTGNPFKGAFIGQVGSYPAIAFPSQEMRDKAMQVMLHYHKHPYFFYLSYPNYRCEFKNGEWIEIT